MSNFSDFRNCVENAPPGTYEQAKELSEVIGQACDDLMRDIRSLGLKANNCDLIYALETAIYEYVKKSNPGETFFYTAEGFGGYMDSPVRQRVIDQAIKNRDFLKRIED